MTGQELRKKSYTFRATVPEHKKSFRIPDTYEVTVIFVGKDNSALERAKAIMVGHQMQTLYKKRKKS